MTKFDICGSARRAMAVVLAFPAFLGAFQGCDGAVTPSARENVGRNLQAATAADAGADATTAVDPLPCAARSLAVTGNMGSVTVNAQSLVDSYGSSAGAYGGSNVGDGAAVQAATSITNHGVIDGTQQPNAPANLAVVPVPAGATNLPLGSASPGSLNINAASQTITLAPGDYVAANLSVSFPGAINVAPAGQVRIWVTGNLNLGGNENLNGVPGNLAFLVTSAGSVNVNSGGSLFGLIYAPTSGVNVNSAVFGSVVGSTVTLNPSGTVHFDQSGACAAAPTSSPASVTALPPPPAQPGCYVGTLNGWEQVQCGDPTAALPGFQHLDISNDGLKSVSFQSGGTTQPPVSLVYGQVETTIESLQCADNAAPGTPPTGTCPSTTHPQWSIQNNTNGFPCNSNGIGRCVVQFGVITDGQTGNTAICIVNADIVAENDAGQATDVQYNTTCVDVAGQNTLVQNNLPFDVTTRSGPLRPFDFANVAGYTLNQGGAPMLAMVTQFSWVSTQDQLPNAEKDVPNRVPGLYAIVAPDQFGLAGQWTRVTGGLMGEYQSAALNLTNAEVLTRIAASSCPGDVSASGPTCATVPDFSSANIQFTTQGPSGETDDLTLIRQPALSFPNRNLVVTDLLASDNVPASSSFATCPASQPNHLYVKDNDGDNGGVPSNSGGTPFWDSPDIFVVPSGAAAPGVNDVASDFQLTAGQPYDVYLRVHNDYGCTPVTGPINVFIDGADPDMGFENWLPVTTGAGSGQYTTFGPSGAAVVPAFGAAILGPFPWTPGDGGHKCLLAAVAADGETEPPTSTQAGQPVLPPAFSSNQIAQRNLQIGTSCTFNVTNTGSNTADLLLGISVTPATPTPGSSGAAAISLTFADPNSTFFNAWNGQSGIAVSRSGANTIVTLDTSYVALGSVPLPAGQSPSVTIKITPANNAPPPSVDVSALLTDPTTGAFIMQNGGTCSTPGQTIVIN